MRMDKRKKWAEAEEIVQYGSTEELMESLEYQDRWGNAEGEALGVKDLRNKSARDILFGMGEAYMMIQEGSMDMEMGTGSPTMDRIREELREGVRRELLTVLYMDMEEWLTAALDEEAEDDEQ
jgi:hypothetical protein